MLLSYIQWGPCFDHCTFSMNMRYFSMIVQAPSLHFFSVQFFLSFCFFSNHHNLLPWLLCWLWSAVILVFNHWWITTTRPIIRVHILFHLFLSDFSSLLPIRTKRKTDGKELKLSLWEIHLFQHILHRTMIKIRYFHFDTKNRPFIMSSTPPYLTRGI